MENKDFCHNCFAEVTESKCGRCGYDSKSEGDSDLALPPGTMLNGYYKIGRTLGIGGFGVAYKAQDTRSGNIVAIKEYVPSEMVYRDYDTNNLEIKLKRYKNIYAEGLASFIDEANCLVYLKGTKYVVDIYDCFNENNTAYFSMEFLETNTLHKMVNNDYDTIYSIFINIAESLKEVHNKGVIHRDISPQNIFYFNDLSIRIIDFGNAKFINKKRNDERLILKPGYAPPELYMKENVQGAWTDIYSLAATLYRVLTGYKPPTALERIDGAPIIPIREFIHNIPYEVERAIDRALDLDYAKRQKSIDEFLKDLNTPINTEYTENVSFIAENGTNNEDVPITEESSQKKVSKGFFNFIKKKQKTKTAYILAYDGKKYNIKNGDDLIVGRADNSDIIVRDNSVSRKHCNIEFDAEKNMFYITDWSSNGTFFDTGEKMSRGTKSVLNPGNSFFIYSSKYTFKVVIRQ